MHLVRVAVCVLAASLFGGALALAQVNGQPSPASTSTSTATVPRLIQIKGSVRDESGKPLRGNLGITFTLYKDANDQTVVWQETQNVQLDSTGHYTVLLGATNEAGLPLEIFSSGEARWLGVRPDGQAEQPRILFLSVAYALKAADTEMLGGKPASAFVLADSLYSSALAAAGTQAGGVNSRSGSKVPSMSLGAGPLLMQPTQTGCDIPPGNTGTGGVNSDGNATTNTIALFSDPCDIESSVISQLNGNIGINNPSPAGMLDVSGTAFIRGLLTLPPTSPATTLQGFNSNAIDFQASSYSSIASSPIPQDFQWQAEPTGNNTSSPSGTLNLLFGSGTTPTETGLSIASNGQISSGGQTFPIPPGAITNNLLQYPSVTVATGTGLSGGGTVQLGGTITLTNTAPSSGGTVTQVSSGTGLTGGPFTTSGTLSLITPVATNNGGTGTTSPLAGFVRGGNPFTAAEISGDCTTNGSNVITCTKSNGSTLGTMAFVGSPVPRANGGLNSTSPGTGLLRDGATPTASEISGDCTTSGSNAITCTKSSGAPFGSGAFANIANYAPLAGATFTGGVTAPLATFGATAPATGGIVLTPTGTATTVKGFVSNPLDIEGSVWNATLGQAVPNLFRWQTEAVGNNTSNAGTTLNLLYGAPGLIKETGISFGVVFINGVANGILNFSPLQTYPGLFATNPQVSSYPTTTTDFASCKTIPVASGSPTITLVASATQPASGQCVFIINYGSGVVTIAPSGQNLNGLPSNLTLAAGSAAAPTGAFVVSDGTNYEAQVFGASGGGGGSGTVTSVGQTINGGATSGIFSVPGPPVTTSGALNINLSGTSGGIPYFSSGTVLTSSGLLPAGNFVLGGGAGLAPTASFSVVPVANGGTATGSTLTGLVRGGNPFTGSELSGDATTSGSNLVTVKGLNGKLLSSLATGLLKNTTITGAPSIATFSDVTALWTAGGSCSSSTFLRGDGQCQSPAGGGTVTSSGYSSGTPLAAFSTATNITPATSANVVSLFSGCSGSQYLGADGSCHTASGAGTVTSVGSGAGLTGGPITTSGSLSIAAGGVTNAMLANSSFTLTPGSGLSGGGLVPLGSSGTLSLLQTCSSGQVLMWSGATWLCGNVGGGGVSGTTNGVAYFSGPSTLTSTSAPADGQILVGKTGGAPALSTLTAGSNISITNGPGSITISAAGGGGTPAFPFFVTGGERTGANQAAAKNVNKLWGFLLPYNVTTSQVTYQVNTADATANLYDIGIYDNSGHLVLNIGATPGTTFAPSKKFLTFNWLQGSTTLPAGRYYVGLTTNCASLCGAVAAGATYVSYAVGLSAGASVGGALAPTITTPADIWNTGNQPTIVIH